MAIVGHRRYILKWQISIFDLTAFVGTLRPGMRLQCVIFVWPRRHADPFLRWGLENPRGGVFKVCINYVNNYQPKMVSVR
jgi:hypothetical protein